MFTAVLAAAAIYQFTIVNGQLDEMQIDQRPWLKIKIPEKVDTFIDKNVIVPITLTNVGKTPAKRVHGWVVVRAYSKDTVIDFRDPTTIDPKEVKKAHGIPFSNFSTGVMFSNDPLTATEIGIISEEPGPFKYETWTREMQNRLLGGETYIGVHGKIIYSDSSGRDHWTQFCGMATPIPINAAFGISEECDAFIDVDNEK